MLPDDIPCVGICITDPDSGYCLGCGRPPLPVSGEGIVAEAAPRRRETPPPGEPDGAERKPD